MHKYSIQLRITGATLDPSEVTTRLGLTPNLMRSVGERRDSHRTWAEALWSFDGVSVTGTHEWDSLERGFDFILDKIGDKAEMVRQYNNDNHVIWWCGHYQSSFDGGPTMSAELLKKLADFGVPIYIDNYTNTDHDES